MVSLRMCFDYCNECKRAFNDKTGTIFHYSDISLSEWFLAIYLFCMPWKCMSISSICYQISIPYRIYYHMVSAVMERLATVEVILKLDRQVET